MYIKTNRITIREFENKDAVNLYQFARECAPYYTIPIYESPQDYLHDAEWYKESSDPIDLFNGRYYAVALIDSDEMVGVVAQGPDEFTKEMGIGYFISKKYRKNGFAYEAVSALVEWCFSVSDIPYLYATISIDNLPSNKLIKKCKFELLEKRVPIKQWQAIENESYFYYRKYRV